MPIKKEVKKQAVVKKEEVSAHKHDDLLKEIAQLKKDLVAVKEAAASLKGQCHSCCGDVASLKKEVQDLKDRPAGGKDNRINVLVDLLNDAGPLELRRLLRSKKDLLK